MAQILKGIVEGPYQPIYGNGAIHFPMTVQGIFAHSSNNFIVEFVVFDSPSPTGKVGTIHVTTPSQRIC